jgi:protein gp37
MGAKTEISWCDATFNPWIGCTKVSPACNGCYAENLMDSWLGRVEWGGPGKGNGTRVRTSAANWKLPIKWNKEAGIAGTRPRVFCASLADVFDNQVPPEWREDLFELIAATPNLVWLLLTKRPQNIVAMVHSSGAIAGNGTRYLPCNAALGTTIEDQTRADLNVPALLHAKEQCGPAFLFVSCEPLLGPIDLSKWLYSGGFPSVVSSDFKDRQSRPLGGISWVIAGGETDQGKHKARPSQVAWFRSLRDQCKATDTAFHLKQWGEYGPSTSGCYSPDPDFVPVERFGKKVTGRILDNREHNGFPELVRT